MRAAFHVEAVAPLVHVHQAAWRGHNQCSVEREVRAKRTFRSSRYEQPLVKKTRKSCTTPTIHHCCEHACSTLVLLCGFSFRLMTPLVTWAPSRKARRLEIAAAGWDVSAAPILRPTRGGNAATAPTQHEAALRLLLRSRGNVACCAQRLGDRPTLHRILPLYAASTSPRTAAWRWRQRLQLPLLVCQQSPAPASRWQGRRQLLVR